MVNKTLIGLDRAWPLAMPRLRSEKSFENTFGLSDDHGRVGIQRCQQTLVFPKAKLGYHCA